MHIVLQKPVYINEWLVLFVRLFNDALSHSSVLHNVEMQAHYKV
jgi:hypothetical protein